MHDFIDNIAIVLGAGMIMSLGMLVSALLIAAIAWFSARVAAEELKRIGIIYTNYRDMREWRANGKPKWAKDPDGTFRMQPSDNETKSNS